MNPKEKIKKGRHLYKKNEYSGIDRETFMTLKLEDKRRVLREQAEKLALYYTTDTEWKEFQSLDMLDD